MKLKSIVLKNFRSYKEEIKVDFNNLTAIIGKNDIGKSTILEALEIFFNNEVVKIDGNDVCVHCSPEDKVLIGCTFTDLPANVVIDSTQTTTLRDEYLLNTNGDLEIYKIFDCTKKTPTFNIVARALHPDDPVGKDLLLTKITGLRTKLKSLGVDENEVDLRSSSSIRKAIWANIEDLKLTLKDIPLDKEEGKSIWESLKKELPTFALFQSDRPSKDEDSEVQDPMKLAVNEALRQVQSELERIKNYVQEKATEVAKLTIEKLKEMDEALANELLPKFKEEPKWANIFKLTLDDDKHIPINKRGSGVRRLILLNFFRAQAEKRRRDINASNIIYAIEEPETSQHPNNQKLLIKSLMDLSESQGCQIILTTHVPELAGLLPVESIRFVEITEDGEKVISKGTEDIYLKVANELGVLPDRRVQVIICVEGPHDVEFLNRISSMLHADDPSIPDISLDHRIAILPLGGGNLKQWVHNHYLKGLGLPEVHIYDRDTNVPPKYEALCKLVNERNDGSWATLTQKREMENYINPKTVSQYFNAEISYCDADDVPSLVAATINSNQNNQFYPINEARTKKLLNKDVASEMTITLLDEVDENQELKSWLIKISNMLK